MAHRPSYSLVRKIKYLWQLICCWDILGNIDRFSDILNTWLNTYILPETPFQKRAQSGSTIFSLSSSALASVWSYLERYIYTVSYSVIECKERHWWKNVGIKVLIDGDDEIDKQKVQSRGMMISNDDDDKSNSSVRECKREMLMGECCNKSPPLFLHTRHPPTIISPQIAKRATSSSSTTPSPSSLLMVTMMTIRITHYY